MFLLGTRDRELFHPRSLVCWSMHRGSNCYLTTNQFIHQTRSNFCHDYLTPRFNFRAKRCVSMRGTVLWVGGKRVFLAEKMVLPTRFVWFHLPACANVRGDPARPIPTVHQCVSRVSSLLQLGRIFTIAHGKAIVPVFRQRYRRQHFEILLCS